MSFSKTGIAVDEQRIIFLMLLLGDCLCGGIGEVVRRADDEVVEGICDLVVVNDVVDLVRQLAAVADIVEFRLVGGNIVLDDYIDFYRVAENDGELFLQLVQIDGVYSVALEIGVSCEGDSIALHADGFERVEPQLLCRS